MKFLTKTLAAAAIAAASLSAQGHKQPTLEVAWNRFYDYEEMVALTKELAATWPEFVTTRELGKSTEGRTLWMLVVNNPATGEHTSKPAFYSDANIHGNEVQGAEANLYLVWYLMENYGKVDRITEIVDPDCSLHRPLGQRRWSRTVVRRSGHLLSLPQRRDADRQRR